MGGEAQRAGPQVQSPAEESQAEDSGAHQGEFVCSSTLRGVHLSAVGVKGGSFEAPQNQVQSPAVEREAAG